MAYCTWEDVQGKMQQITISTESNPTNSKVIEFITEVSADMDSRMQSAGITLPVSAADKLIVLNGICINGAKAEVLRSVGLYENASEIQKLYDNAMDRIQNNPSIIESAETVSQSPGYYEAPASPVIDRFQRGVKQW